MIRRVQWVYDSKLTGKKTDTNRSKGKANRINEIKHNQMIDKTIDKNRLIKRLANTIKPLVISYMSVYFTPIN